MPLQRKAWHPDFKVGELTLDVIKQNLELARAEEAARAVSETGVAFGECQRDMPPVQSLQRLACVLSSLSEGVLVASAAVRAE